VTVAVALLAAVLAAVNGANDVAKGVATLAGSRVSRYRVAVGYGAVTTLAGSLAAVWLGGTMRTLFSSGIVDAVPSARLALAVLAGAAGWVGLATLARLPVSTTHALVGALIGAGLLAAPDALRWPALTGKVALPMVASAVAAYLLSALLGGPARPRVEDPGLRAVVLPVPSLAYLAPRVLTGLHWMSAGAVGAARGLNDTPKLAAVAGFALLPAGIPAGVVVAGIAVAMFAGALIAGTRVAPRLGEDVVRLDHADGLRASLTTAVLVGGGAAYGLPMSTTHVSTGAIAGVAGPRPGRLNLTALRDFALAWTLTPVIGGVLAAGAYRSIGG